LRNQSKNRNSILVTFKESVHASLLENLAGVKSATNLNANEWELVSDNINDTKRLLLELSLQHNLNIVSLQSGEQRLEDVFKNLTSNSSN